MAVKINAKNDQRIIVFLLPIVNCKVLFPLYFIGLVSKLIIIIFGKVHDKSSL